MLSRGGGNGRSEKQENHQSLSQLCCRDMAGSQAAGARARASKRFQNRQTSAPRGRGPAAACAGPARPAATGEHGGKPHVPGEAP